MLKAASSLSCGNHADAALMKRPEANILERDMFVGARIVGDVRPMLHIQDSGTKICSR